MERCHLGIRILDYPKLISQDSGNSIVIYDDLICESGYVTSIEGNKITMNDPYDLYSCVFHHRDYPDIQISTVDDDCQMIHIGYVSSHDVICHIPSKLFIQLMEWRRELIEAGRLDSDAEIELVSMFDP